MTALEDAVKAAAEAGQGVSHDFLVECGLTDNEADAAINAVAEAAVDAAAPILLADAQAIFETLTVTTKARQEQVERLIAEVARWKALVDAKQSWIDGAKVDLAAAEAEIERLQADLDKSVRAIDHYAGALRTTKEIAAAERARIARLLRDARDIALARATDARNRFQPSDADMWETRADAYERAALDAETAPEEPS